MAAFTTRSLKGNWDRVTVSRVIPGKVVFVSNTANETLAFKPDKFSIRDKNGSLHHYRGQSFSELGLNVGSKVNVSFEHDSPVLVVDAEWHKF